MASDIQLNNCPLCNATTFTHYLTTKDYSLTKEEFNLVTCSSCSLVFTNPRPTEQNIGNYYKFSDYISHSNTTKGIIGKLYTKVRSLTIQRKVKLVKKHARGKNLLDVGCGTGYFLEAAKNAGFTVLGLEPDEAARQQVKEKNCAVSDITALHTLTNTYDCITLWHVLEHVYHLQKDAAQLVNLLNDKGVLFIAVPNLLSYDAKKYSKFWAAYDVPRHLYHFSEANVKQLFTGLGLSHVATLPMKFDAYYVSMLSQKHMGKGIVGGFFTGWLSNFYAWLKKAPYSSQIYVFKKVG